MVVSVFAGCGKTWLANQSMDMSLRELGVKRAPQSWMYLLVPDDKTF